jgi:ubiquinone/menaquinone biosynthesis C-methylase UbiE
MKNILNEKPDKKITGRLKFSTEFVSDKDIKSKKILDIGCGFGWFELNALKKGVKQIAGIEISSEDLKAARENIKDKRAIFKVGGGLKVPFKDSYFDTVVAWEVIEHIPKNTENKMFQEVNRVLKSNGVFYLSTPYNSFLATVFDPAFWLIGHRHYSKNKLIMFGEKNKFTVLNMYIKGRFWSLASLFNMYVSKWIFRREPIFKIFFERKENKEYLPKKEGFMGVFVKYEK